MTRKTPRLCTFLLAGLLIERCAHVEVKIIPTYGLYPFDDPNALAYYNYENDYLSR
jgi:hypothetical protein